ncbi:hypothetical protein TUM17570_34100 [Enterobacter cloacae]|nr:hypothetical protein TUM17570_34100 [Enterobacter cloacae]
MQYRQADAVLLVEHKGFTDIFNVDHFGLAIRFAGWRLRLTRPTGAVFVLPGKRSATRQPRPQFCNTDDTSSWVYG